MDMPATSGTDRLLGLIEADAEARLRLRAAPGQRVVLTGLRLDPASLKQRAAGGTPAWWDGRGVRLRDAELSGVDLPDADLSGADLTGATLAGCTLRAARLVGARLETARLDGADLSGADLTGALASEADFTDAWLEDARFTGAQLRFAQMSGALLDKADLKGADLWGAKLDRAEAQGASFRRARLHEASLNEADLSGAVFDGAELKKACLRGCRLKGADLRGADLAGADLDGADLSGASLPRLDLTSCSLAGARLSGAWLESTRLDLDQLGPGLGEELAGDHILARRGYLALEQNFRSLGDPETATACYLRARRMGKRAAFGKLRTAIAGRKWRQVPLCFGQWAGDAFAEWLCDYGESLPRVLRAFVILLLCFAVFYGLSGSLVYTSQGTPPRDGSRVENVWELLGFSFLNTCMSGIPDIGIRPSTHFIYFVTSTQYVLGLVLIGLFGYVLGNRIRR